MLMNVLVFSARLRLAVPHGGLLLALIYQTLISMICRASFCARFPPVVKQHSLSSVHHNTMSFPVVTYVPIAESRAPSQQRSVQVEGF